MASGFTIKGVNIESIFIWDSTASQSDDSTGYKTNNVDISKYMYNCSTNSYSSGIKKNGVDIGTLYCTSGCNAVCVSCTSCTSTCSKNGCTSCTSTCSKNGCTSCSSCTSCTGGCTTSRSSSCSSCTGA